MLLEPNCVDNFIDEQLYKKMLDIAIDELVEIAEDSEIYLVDNMRTVSYTHLLGINKSKAWEWANTRKSYWHIANSFILKRTLTNEALKIYGFISALDYYNSINLWNAV